MSVVDRASLLRALFAVPREHRVAIAEAFGCEMQVAHEKQTEGDSSSDEPTELKFESSVHPSVISTVRVPPAFWALTATHSLPVDDTELSALVPPSRKYEEEAWPDTPPPVQCLPESRLQLFWDSLLTSPEPGNKVDIEGAVVDLSRNKPVDKLPRRRSDRVAEHLTLLFDVDEEAKPVHTLYEQLLVSLRQRVSQEQLTLLTVNHSGLCRNAKSGASMSLSAVCRDAHVLAFGAFGSVSHHHRVSPGWVSSLHNIKRVAHQLHVCSVYPLTVDGIKVIPLEERNEDSNVPLLLQVLCRLWMPDAELLWQIRAVCSDVSIADLLTVYNRNEVIAHDPYISLSHDAVKTLLREEQQRSRAEEIVQIMQPWLWRTERNAARLQSSMNTPSSLSMDEIEWIESIAAATVHGEFGKQSEMAASVMASLVPLLRHYANNATNKRWRALLNVAQKVAVQSAQALPLGPLNLKNGQTLGAIIQRGDRLVVSAAINTALVNISDHCYCENSNKLVTRRWQGSDEQVVLIDNNVRYQFEKIRKPSWADRMWRSGNGTLHAAHESGFVFSFNAVAGDAEKWDWLLEKNTLSWASNAGIDQDGLWADLTISDVTQRLRWIEPGTFEMGSPNIEEGRFQDETQHAVTLSSGYWLAETSCTQAFWASANGGDKVDSDSDHTQASISWNECQRWLSSLTNQVTGLTLRMPSEAEWEYACRAGTTTAYWFGDNFNTDNVNQSGQPNVESGLPANPWGLKSMNGNVSELSLIHI